MIKFWDFRHWRKPELQVCKDYLEKFAKHNIAAMILLDQDEISPFIDIQKFVELWELGYTSIFLEHCNLNACP